MIKRHYLYRIVNNENGNTYIGQSIDPKARWYRHRRSAGKPKYAMSFALNKHGIENFTFEVIVSGVLSCTCQIGQPGPCQANANAEEIYLIQQYNSHKSTGKGYNETIGGQAGPITPEAREKQRNWRANLSTEERTEISRKISEAGKGRKPSKESRKKAGETRKNRTGIMVCGVPDCGVIENRNSASIDGVRYCKTHYYRLKNTGVLHLRPRKAHNKKVFTDEQITKILADTRGAEQIAKGYATCEPVILRIKKQHNRTNSRIGKSPRNKIQFTQEQIEDICSGQKASIVRKKTTRFQEAS